MRSFAFVFLLFSSIQAFGQTDIDKNYKPDTDIKVSLCGSRVVKDSICHACYDCYPRLIASDSNISIVSFKVTAWGEGFDDDILEAINIGNYFASPYTLYIVKMLQKGSYIEFSGIKAKHKNGRTYILQSLLLEL